MHPSATAALGDLPASGRVGAVPRAVYRAPEPPSSRASQQTAGLPCTRAVSPWRPCHRQAHSCIWAETALSALSSSTNC